MTTSTQITRLATGIAVILTAATAIAPAALAGGEPKNEGPFARSVVSGRALREGLGVSHATAAAVIAGELKNQAPFTLHVSRVAATVVIAGEPKNQLPFTRR
jgi:hypothetical protein